MAHNGNLANAYELSKKLFKNGSRHISITSDLKNFLKIFIAMAATHQQIRYALLLWRQEYRLQHVCRSRSEWHLTASEQSANVLWWMAATNILRRRGDLYH
ncbi:MAG: hypothetical protein FKGGLIKP_00226 [Sodalis sp. Fse]|nr:MAG: hypothetical protein FKGGLIKP_00226 [Sodalis sp. Fse]